MLDRETRKGMKISFECHIGHVRKRQEDYFYIDPVKNLFIIADGMGGHSDGDKASKTAVESFKSNYEDSMIEAFLLADQDVINLDKDGNIDAGTTLIAATIKNKELNYCSVGDSYLYLYRKSGYREINYPSDSPNFGYLNILDKDEYGYITQALGGHYNYLNPHTGSMDLESKDIIILATDGIDSIWPREVEALCKEKGEDLAKIILEEVLKTEARDNITLICIEID